MKIFAGLRFELLTSN